MTKVHSESVLMVLVDKGLENFLVTDLMPVPSSLSFSIPGLPAKLKPGKGLDIFLTANTPVGSLATPAAVALPFFLVTCLDPEVEVPAPVEDFFLFFNGVLVSLGAPASPEEGVEKNRSACSAMVKLLK